MRDKQIGRPLLLLIILQKINDLRLNRHIQGGNRLITDHDIRLQYECTCDADSLPLAAGKFMCITAGMLLRQTDTLQHRVNDRIRLTFFLYNSMRYQRLRDDVAYRHTGIQ